LSGTLSVQLDETTGTWTFDSLYAAATTATEYTLRFSNHWIASVDQIIEVTLGVKGHALVIVLPDDFAWNIHINADGRVGVYDRQGR
jgi:hypothetical protein